MICNVCGEDTRCYSLLEVDILRGHLVPSGLVFNICSECLDRLISKIKKSKTKLDDPSIKYSHKDLLAKFWHIKKFVSVKNGNDMLTEEVQ